MFFEAFRMYFLLVRSVHSHLCATSSNAIWASLFFLFTNCAGFSLSKLFYCEHILLWGCSSVSTSCYEVLAQVVVLLWVHVVMRFSCEHMLLWGCWPGSCSIVLTCCYEVVAQVGGKGMDQKGRRGAMRPSAFSHDRNFILDFYPLIHSLYLL